MHTPSAFREVLGETNDGMIINDDKKTQECLPVNEKVVCNLTLNIHLRLIVVRF